MLLAGDEIGRTQRGNNNAYCQDNEVAWVNWSAVTADDDQLLAFVRRAIALRKAHPHFRQPVFLHGSNATADGVKDIVWVSPRGTEQTFQDWQDANAKCIGLQLNGAAGSFPDSPSPDRAAEVVLVVMNAGDHIVRFTLPTLPHAGAWQALIDTVDATGGDSKHLYPAGSGFEAQGRSLTVFAFSPIH